MFGASGTVFSGGSLRSISQKGEVMDQVNVSWYVEDVSAHSAPVLIAGLPGVGHVGKLVVDHLVQVLSAEKVAEITSTLFPPQMYLGENAVLRLPRNEVFLFRRRVFHRRFFCWQETVRVRRLRDIMFWLRRICVFWICWASSGSIHWADTVSGRWWIIHECFLR